jgi:stress response protein YsnF
VTPASGSAADAPFPGARSQVTGKPIRSEAAIPPLAAPELLLEASVPADAQGWVVRLPVRAEHIEVEKQSVVYERVVVRRGEVDDVERVDTSIRRETLNIETEKRK